MFLRGLVRDASPEHENITHNLVDQKNLEPLKDQNGIHQQLTRCVLSFERKP